MAESRPQDLLDEHELDGVLEPELRLASYFDELASDSGNEITVGIYEVDEKNGRKSSFLFPIVPGELAPHELFAQLLDEYGPGTYRALAKSPDGRIAFRQQFSVGSSKAARRRIPKADRDDERTSSRLDPQLAAILAGQQRLLEKIADSIDRRPESKSTEDVIRELTAARELLAPASAPASGGLGSLGDVVGIVRQVLELRDELGGNDGDALTTGIKTLGPAILKAVEYLQQNPPKPAEPAGIGRTLGAPTVEPNAGVGRLIGPYLPIIMANARGGVLPVDAARQIMLQLGNLGDEHKAAFLDWLDDENAVENLARMDRGVLELRDWFEQLVDILIASLRHELGELEDPSDDDDGTEPGHERDAAGAEPGPSRGGVGREVGEFRAGTVDSHPNAAGNGSSNADANAPPRADDARAQSDPGG